MKLERSFDLQVLLILLPDEVPFIPFQLHVFGILQVRTSMEGLAFDYVT